MNSNPRIALALFLSGLLAASPVAFGHGEGKGSTPSDHLHQIMADGMKSGGTMKMTGDVDKDFAAMMIIHHQQAIDMARIEGMHGTNPELKAMAAKMATDQQKEIDALKKFTGR